MTRRLAYAAPPLYKAFESELHSHTKRLSKAELAYHLTLPHKTDTGWISNAGSVSDLMKWRRDELDRTHAEFHGAS